MREIDRACFKSLNRDTNHHYIILVDGWYDTEFWADNDDEARRIFHEEYVKTE